MQSIIKINMFLKTNANEKGKVCNSMENTRVIVVYADGNLSVSVNGTKLNTESIKGKPIDEWFEVSNGRDGWKGLIPEIQVYVGNVQLDFEFSGAQEDKAIFEKCLKKRGFVCSTDGLPKEEVMQINLEDAKKAEQRGLWKEAFEGYKKAAEYGNSIEAQYKVGEIYYKVSKGELSVSGIDVESAVGKAIQYLEKAAKTDNANAKYYLYKALLDIPENQNEEEAIKWLKEAAQLGLAEAQSELGVCYQTGRGVEKKLEEAVGWFQKAADQNDAFAQNRLGNRYQLGEGVSKDLEKAFQWFQRAADGGFVKAYLNLAKCYCFGNGTEKDLNEAERYLRKYIEKIMENKEEFLGASYICGNFWGALAYSGEVSEEKKKEYQTEMFQCFEISAKEEEDVNGMYELAKCYEYGKGTEKNENEAIYWYQKAATSDEYCPNDEAMVRLGDIYDEKRRQEEVEFEDLEKSSELEFQWYGKAAENGNAEGACELGNCYFYSIGTELDWEKAEYWYQVAIDKKYLPAFLRMADYYALIKDDLKKAWNLAHRAYEEGDESLRKEAAEFMMQNEIERTCIEYQSSHCSSTQICSKKNILSAYNIKDPIEYLSHDATLTKNGKEGFVITDCGIYFRDMFDKRPFILKYETLVDLDNIVAQKNNVPIEGHTIPYFGDSTEDLAELLRKIRSIARKYLKD